MNCADKPTARWWLLQTVLQLEHNLINGKLQCERWQDANIKKQWENIIRSLTDLRPAAPPLRNPHTQRRKATQTFNIGISQQWQLFTISPSDVFVWRQRRPRVVVISFETD